MQNYNDVEIETVGKFYNKEFQMQIKQSLASKSNK